MKISLRVNIIFAPETFSARFDTDLYAKKGGRLVSVFSAIDYFFLYSIIPTKTTAIMTAITPPIMVRV